MSRKTTIRNAEEDDAPALLAIYRPYIEQTAITFEIVPPTEKEFRKRIRSTLITYPFLVAEQEGKPVGYAYARAFNERKAYQRSCETSIYVDRFCRKGGVGKALYCALEEAVDKMGIINLNAAISMPKTEDDPYLTTNSADFHRHLGYQLVGTFHDCAYKFDRWYDLIWMEKMISTHSACPKPFRPYPVC